MEKMKDDLYEFFEVDEKASKEEIKKAYRKKAKETHPDVNKDNREEFEKANKYYMILVDDNKRKKYDETGSINEKIDKSIHLQFLATIFKNVIESVTNSDGAINLDIFELIKKKLDENIHLSETNIKKIKSEIKQIKKVIKQIKSKLDKKENIFILMLDDIIQKCKEQQQLQKDNIKMIKEAKTYLNENEFTFDFERPHVTEYNHTQFTQTMSNR